MTNKEIHNLHAYLVQYISEYDEGQEAEALLYRIKQVIKEEEPKKNNKPMTKAARKHHLATAGLDCCPYCKISVYNPTGNDMVKFGEVDHRCWIDVFTLTHVIDRDF